MNSWTRVGRTNRKIGDTAARDSSTGERAIALSPQNYGLDFVDRGMPATTTSSLPVQLQGHPEEEQLLQGKFAPLQRRGPESQATPHDNKTGLPDNLKSGVESLSGISLDNVKVHHNSSQPAQVNALAYAQGSNIHVAPGQERHLPHEAWHVVQQAQERVKLTMQMKGGVPVNDDAKLENEADAMGRNASEAGRVSALEPERLRWGDSSPAQHVIQRFESPEHIDLGDTAGGAAPGLIVLRCHDRDFPERGRPFSEWPKAWQELHARSTPQQQRAMTQGLTYGEVIALSGDLYADFNALNDAPLNEVIGLIPLIHRKTTTTEEFETATGGRYLALAKINESHFSNVRPGHRNIDVWRSTHHQAITAARTGNANLAWGLNASADHFLTDAFSGGHIRTPRAALMGSDLGNIESKILHDLDNTYGVQVTNPRGDPPWIAYGDNHLDDPRNAVSKVKALEAVQLSKQDVADALQQGSNYPELSPTAPFPAEALIPRPVDPSKDRWTGRIPRYAVGPRGPMRQVDDYTMMRDKVVVSEGPGVVSGFLNDDDQVRAWVKATDLAALGRQPPDEKIRMLNTLIGGFISYISEADMAAMEKILRSVTTGAEMNLIRAAMKPRELDFSDLGQRTRFRVFLARNP